MESIEHKFRFSPDEYKTASAQVTGTHSLNAAYLSLCEGEYEAYLPHLPGKYASVLDLGCGLGRASVYLNWMLGESTSVNFTLADSYSYPGLDDLKYGWNPKEWYNSMTYTKQFVDRHGLHNYQYHNLCHGLMQTICPKFGVVISFLAVGFHFPIERYMNHGLRDLLDKDCTLIFGIRKKSEYHAKSFEEWFREVLVVPVESKGYTTHQKQLLILRGLL